MKTLISHLVINIVPSYINSRLAEATEKLSANNGYELLTILTIELADYTLLHLQ